MNKINVLQLISSGGMYGAEQVVLALSKKMIPPCYSSIIACLKDGKAKEVALAREARKLSLKIEIIDMQGRFDPGAISKIANLAKKLNISVIHSHGYKADILGFLAAKLARMPIVATHHAWTQEAAKIRFYNWLDSLFLRFFPVIVPVSDRVREDLLARGIDSGKIQTIYNGIDLERLRRGIHEQEVLKELGINLPCKIVTAVGRLIALKGFRYLLDAAADILRKNKNIIFILIGDGPLRNELREYAKSLGIEKEVIFTGFRYDVNSFLSLSHLFVMPSASESMPMALLEAMGLGKPVIATRVGGIPTVVAQGETGILINPKDHLALSEAIKGLLENEQLARKMGSAAKKLVESKYSLEVMAQRYGEVYSELIKQREIIKR